MLNKRKRKGLKYGSISTSDVDWIQFYWWPNKNWQVMTRPYNKRTKCLGINDQNTVMMNFIFTRRVYGTADRLHLDGQHGRQWPSFTSITSLSLSFSFNNDYSSTKRKGMKRRKYILDSTGWCVCVCVCDADGIQFTFNLKESCSPVRCAL